MARRMLPPLALVVAIAIVMRKILKWWLTGATTPLRDLVSPYNLAILSYDYFQNGFVRRGFGGTVVAMLGGAGDHVAASVLFFLLSAVFLAVPLALLLRRLQQLPGHAAAWFALVLVAAPQLFWGWGQDIARADMLVAGIVAWAAIAALARRHVLALATVGAGYAVHDTAVVYGAMLVGAIGLIDYRAGRAGIRQAIVAMGALIGVVVLIVIGQHLFGDPRGAIRTMLSRYPTMAEAAYFTFGGLRGAIESACGSFSRPGVFLYIGGAFAVLLLYLPLLLYRRRLSLAVFAIAALLPMTAMTVVAIDYGRWLIFAVFNAWLAAVALRLRGIEAPEADRRSHILAALALLVLLPMRSTTPMYPTMAIAELVGAIWGNEPRLSGEQCDPTWREVIAG